jgi:hypothetical protein
MIGGSSSAYRFDPPNIDTIGGVQIKRIPAGEAFGARDLARWASHRRAGRSGARASVEKTKRGWMALLPDGAVGGPFATKDSAWQWISAHLSHNRSFVSQGWMRKKLESE